MICASPVKPNSAATFEFMYDFVLASSSKAFTTTLRFPFETVTGTVRIEIIGLWVHAWFVTLLERVCACSPSVTQESSLLPPMHMWRHVTCACASCTGFSASVRSQPPLECSNLLWRRWQPSRPHSPIFAGQCLLVWPPLRQRKHNFAVRTTSHLSSVFIVWNVAHCQIRWFPLPQHGHFNSCWLK